MGAGAAVAVGAATALVGAGIKAGATIRAGKKRKKLATKLSNEGDALEKKAWSEKVDYKSPEEIAALNNLAQANLNDNSVEGVMKQNADLGASNTLARVSRSATSASDAASMAAAAEQQRIAGYNQGALAGAQEYNADRGFLAQTVEMVKREADDKYNDAMISFRLKYAKSQQRQQAGLQGEIDNINQSAAEWASFGNGLMQAGGTIMGMPADAFGGKGKRKRGIDDYSEQPWLGTLIKS